MTFEPNVIATEAATARLLAHGRTLQARAVRQGLRWLAGHVTALLAGPVAARRRTPADRRRVLAMTREPLWH